MTTDTEDPNIATLRAILHRVDEYGLPTCAMTGLPALDTPATTLAEKEARIRELEEELAGKILELAKERTRDQRETEREGEDIGDVGSMTVGSRERTIDKCTEVVASMRTTLDEQQSRISELEARLAVPDVQCAIDRISELEARTKQAAPGELGCFDCGRKYSLGPDLVVSDADFARIAPNPPEGGVLCPNCMHDRFAALQGDPHAAGGILARFTSGPFAALTTGGRVGTEPDKPAPYQPKPPLAPQCTFTADLGQRCPRVPVSDGLCPDQVNVGHLSRSEPSAPVGQEPYHAQREGWQKHIETHHTTLEAYQAARADGYEAGRASEAKRWFDQNTAIMRDHEDTLRKWDADKDELERVRAELGRRTGERDDAIDQLEHARAVLGLDSDADVAVELAKLREGREKISDLDRIVDETLRGLHKIDVAVWVEPSEDELGNALAASIRGFISTPDRLALARTAKSALLGVRRVAVPTREQIAEAICRELGMQTPGAVHLRAGDAVLRLLSAEAKAGQDSGKENEDAPTDASDRIVRAGRGRAESGPHDTAHEGTGHGAHGDEPSAAPQVATRTEARATAERQGEVAQPSHPVTDSEPPTPLPPVLPPGSRSVRGSDRSGWELELFTQSGYPAPRYVVPHRRSSFDSVESIDWSHYRAQQRAEATQAVEEMTFEEFVHVHGLTVETFATHDLEHDVPCRGAYLKLGTKRCEVREGPMLGSIFAKGVTDQEAIARLPALYAGKALRFGARLGHHSETDPECVKLQCPKSWRSPDPPPKAPGGFLDAITARVAQLEGQVRGMAEGTAGEFRRVDAQSKRLDALERKVRELDQRTIGGAK